MTVLLWYYKNIIPFRTEKMDPIDLIIYVAKNSSHRLFVTVNPTYHNPLHLIIWKIFET